MLRRHNLLRSERGFSLIEAMIACGVLAIIALATAQLNAVMLSQSSQIVSLGAIDLFRQKLVRTILSTDSWALTVHMNARPGAPFWGGGSGTYQSMNCLKLLNGACPNTTFDPAANPRFRLYNISMLDDESYFDVNGPTVPTAVGPIYDSRQAQSGITLAGRKCNTYPAGNCVLRFNMRWYALSNGPSPQIVVYAYLQAAANRVIEKNLMAHGIGFFSLWDNGNPRTPLGAAAGGQVFNAVTRPAR